MLNKQPLTFNFSQGLDTKTDPYQVSVGKFLSLKNSVFTKGGLLQKRNGYGSLPTITPPPSYLTTFNGDLTAIGGSISALSSGTSTWITKGSTQPLSLNTPLPIIRNNLNQTQCDSAISPTGLVCTVYSEINAGSTSYKYVIADSTTGQNIVAPALIPVTSGTVTGSARVFLLDNYFIIVFTNVISGGSHLQYVAIPISRPASYTANADLVSSYGAYSTLSWDGVVVENNLYISYYTPAAGTSVSILSLSSGLVITTRAPFTGNVAQIVSMCADVSNPSSPIIYGTFCASVSSSTSVGYTFAVDSSMRTVFSPTQTISSATVLNIATSAQNGVCNIYTEVQNAYSYDSSIPTHFINANTITLGGVAGSAHVSIRSAGLASKAFIVDGVSYYLSAYQSTYQPSYFLVNATYSTAAQPVTSAKLAYENGGGYLTTGLPNVTITDNIVQVPYLYKDFIEALNTLGNSQQTTAGGIYSQTGINLAGFVIGTQGLDSAEIANNLHLSGGFLWQYDGYLPVEHNFFLWPDNVEASVSATGGSISAQQYYYQSVYSWSDNQGNVYRSAPSIPITVTTVSSISSITVDIPTLRLTAKTANPVKIELYRWSAAQQVYYQVTSITSPLLNSTTTDSVTYVDTASDASILGNNILYTTGGVVEDVNAPATSILTLFDTRLWLVDAEDPNLLWFSKQVIEATPVEMSDLLTFYIAPTTAAQGSTGNITALAPMDDKLVIFKDNAIYYINGTGPDNTGSNNQYSQPIFITSTVGCANQKSIVFMPQGLMFQSDKGIWLLGRDLSTTYIGAGVEGFNSAIVESAINIPGTNEVRFTLDSGSTLLYDYYYGQWGEFVGIPGVSSTLYQGLHTFVNSEGQVFQETPGAYLDGTNPVLMSFTTAWLALSGVQGFQRAYYFYMLGTYMSPHTLEMQIAYDFVSSTAQTSYIKPDNYSVPYADDPNYGSTPYWGGETQLEQWRVFLQQQKCRAIQLTVNEVFDPSFGTAAGAGLTMSGFNFVIGAKKGYPVLRPSRSVG